MLQSLADPVLPIFAVMMVGYILGRARVLGPTDARAINQFAFYLGVPAIIIWVVAKTPLDALDWTAVLLFLASQLTLYALVFAILHFGLKREVRESLLLGMSAVFVNHVFFVLPIAERLYGEVARAHMSGKGQDAGRGGIAEQAQGNADERRVDEGIFEKALEAGLA